MFGCLPGWYAMYMFLGGLLPPNIIFQDAKFTLRPSLAYCTALEQRVSAKLCGVVQGMDYGTFAESATYTRQGGHHIRHRPTF